MRPLEPHTGLMVELKQLQWLKHWASGILPTDTLLTSHKRENLKGQRWWNSYLRVKNLGKVLEHLQPV